ncbi:MAG: hypothetical protein VB071_09195 [Lawsonibacter sp.]|nr:hypothetical protein [Lawsonibacter sp.]
MKQINRLLIEAKKMAGLCGVQLSLAMIDREGDQWSAKGYLWDGVTGSQLMQESAVRPTLDAAMGFIYELAEKYPNSRDVAIIIDDLGG